MITENSNEENQILGTHDKNVDITCYINASKSEKGIQNKTAIPRNKSITV